jgi:3-isopropylmalate/(R)-2-methylmalate dehydratase small subunit
LPLARRLVKQNNINTDCIIPARFKHSLSDEKELCEHLFYDMDEHFHENVQQGDFLVAGLNFGCGSSREQAPQAIKAAGFSAVIAKSFDRIFYRNSFNIGLCLVECETNYIDDMDELELDLEKNTLKNLSKGVFLDIKPIPGIMRKFLSKGGVLEYFREKGGFGDVDIRG